jgi:hypothetical protein
LPSSAELRRRLHAVNSFSEVEGIFGDYLRWLESRSFDHAGAEAADEDTAELETAEA